eukprot:GHVN01035614.1.p1 GENE.GHVN01035614.1~~GHVN01035614.1.p1  ORF type:complete len:1239 (+),score=126.50 GHVN01035614.1:5099-8815(+)
MPSETVETGRGQERDREEDSKRDSMERTRSACKISALAETSQPISPADDMNDLGSGASETIHSLQTPLTCVDPTRPPKTDLLLRLFESDMFTADMHMQHLHQRQEFEGVFTYLVNKLYGRSDEEIDYYLPQLCQLSLVDGAKRKNHSSLALFMVLKAAKSAHFALKAHWQYESVQEPELAEEAEGMKTSLQMAVVNRAAPGRSVSSMEPPDNAVDIFQRQRYVRRVESAIRAREGLKRQKHKRLNPGRRNRRCLTHAGTSNTSQVFSGTSESMHPSTQADTASNASQPTASKRIELDGGKRNTLGTLASGSTTVDPSTSHTRSTARRASVTEGTIGESTSTAPSSDRPSTRRQWAHSLPRAMYPASQGPIWIEGCRVAGLPNVFAENRMKNPTESTSLTVTQGRESRNIINNLFLLPFMQKTRRCDYFEMLNNFIKCLVEVSCTLADEPDRSLRQPLAQKFMDTLNLWMAGRRCFVAAVESTFTMTGLTLPMMDLGKEPSLEKHSLQIVKVCSQECRVFSSKKRAPVLMVFEVADLDEDLHKFPNEHRLKAQSSASCQSGSNHLPIAIRLEAKHAGTEHDGDRGAMSDVDHLSTSENEMDLDPAVQSESSEARTPMHPPSLDEDANIQWDSLYVYNCILNELKEKRLFVSLPSGSRASFRESPLAAIRRTLGFNLDREGSRELESPRHDECPRVSGTNGEGESPDPPSREESSASSEMLSLDSRPQTATTADTDGREKLEWQDNTTTKGFSCLTHDDGSSETTVDRAASNASSTAPLSPHVSLSITPQHPSDSLPPPQSSSPPSTPVGSSLGPPQPTPGTRLHSHTHKKTNAHDVNLKKYLVSLKRVASRGRSGPPGNPSGTYSPSSRDRCDAASPVRGVIAESNQSDATNSPSNTDRTGGATNGASRSNSPPRELARPGDLPVQNPTRSLPPPETPAQIRHRLFGEPWDEKKARLKKESSYGVLGSWDLRCVLVKGGDDLRQELLASQLVKQFKAIFDGAKIPLWLRPYEILVTGDESGIIEFVPNTLSVDSLKRNFNPDCVTESVNTVFEAAFADCIHEARMNFIKSYAAYSLVCYLLQVRDRHNGNLLLDNKGRLLHIDYGFMLMNSPGNRQINTWVSSVEQSPFKLTREYLDIMGGEKSDTYILFRSLIAQGFLECRKQQERIVLLVQMMQSASRMPCFMGKPDRAIELLEARFLPSTPEDECLQRIQEKIDKSVQNMSTILYDGFQRHVNQIC